MWKNLIDIWKSDNLLEEAWNESFEMLDTTYNMFKEASKILRTGKKMSLSAEIRKRDKLVNKYMQDVRRKVLTHCSVQGNEELPGGLILATIVIDIERLGDYTKNVLDIISYNPQPLNAGKFTKKLDEVENAIKDEFTKTRQCIEESDEELSIKILKDTTTINNQCTKLIKDLVQEKDKALSPSEAVTLTLYLRCLKRINSHLRNVLTSLTNPFDTLGLKPQI